MRTELQNQITPPLQPRIDMSRRQDPVDIMIRPQTPRWALSGSESGVVSTPFWPAGRGHGPRAPFEFFDVRVVIRAKDRFSGKPGATREQGAGEEEGGCQAQRQPSPDLSPTLGRRFFFFAVAFRPDTRFAFLPPSKLPALSDWDAGRPSAARAAAVCHPQND